MNLRDLDRRFSLIIRSSNGWSCARCGKDLSGNPEELHCAHFHSRTHHSVRFDPENCDAVCWECHFYLDGHPSEHEAWKRAQLGETRFSGLEQRARLIIKLDKQTVRTFIKDLSCRAA